MPNAAEIFDDGSTVRYIGLARDAPMLTDDFPPDFAAG